MKCVRETHLWEIGPLAVCAFVYVCVCACVRAYVRTCKKCQRTLYIHNKQTDRQTDRQTNKHYTNVYVCFCVFFCFCQGERERMGASLFMCICMYVRARMCVLFVYLCVYMCVCACARVLYSVS